MNCPKCNSDDRVKNGKVKGVQRYKCKGRDRDSGKDCGCNYTTKIRLNERPIPLKRTALHLYIEGMNYNAISCLLHESRENVKSWIEKYCSKGLARIRIKSKISEIQASEIYKHTRKKGKEVRFLLIEVTDKQSKAYIVTDKKKLKKLTKK